MMRSIGSRVKILFRNTIRFRKRTNLSSLTVNIKTSIAQEVLWHLPNELKNIYKDCSFKSRVDYNIYF